VPLVAELIELLRPSAAGREVDIRLETAREVTSIVVLADRQRFRQVVLNLLSNAVKYNRSAGSFVASWRLIEPNRVRLEIADTGLGMTAEQQTRLFEPFVRLGAESSGVEGTGLGLAISKHLIEAMGGSIGVESAAGNGTTAWIEIGARRARRRARGATG
jgi:signal transduction histidine kinase